MKGIHKEIQKLQASDVDKHILNSRIVASDSDFQKSTVREQQDVLAKWHQLPLDFTKKQTRKEIFNDDILRLRSHSKDKLKDKEDHASYVRTSETQIVAPVPRSAAFVCAPETLQQISSYDSQELEEVIQESVKITSKGNPEQDRSIERAIRASVSEFQYVAKNTSAQDEEGKAYQQAVRASMIGDGRTGRQELGVEFDGPSAAWVGTPGGQGVRELQLSGTTGGSWLTDDPELERALHKSLIEQGAHVEEDKLERALRESGEHRSSTHGLDNWDKFEKPFGEFETYQNVPKSESGVYGEHDDEFSKAIEESRRLNQEREIIRREEDQFVMEYAIKASLQEQ